VLNHVPVEERVKKLIRSFFVGNTVGKDGDVSPVARKDDCNIAFDTSNRHDDIHEGSYEITKKIANPLQNHPHAKDKNHMYWNQHQELTNIGENVQHHHNFGQRLVEAEIDLGTYNDRNGMLRNPHDMVPLNVIRRKEEEVFEECRGDGQQDVTMYSAEDDIMTNHEPLLHPFHSAITNYDHPHRPYPKQVYCMNHGSVVNRTESTPMGVSKYYAYESVQEDVPSSSYYRHPSSQIRIRQPFNPHLENQGFGHYGVTSIENHATGGGSYDDNMMDYTFLNNNNSSVYQQQEQHLSSSSAIPSTAIRTKTYHHQRGGAGGRRITRHCLRPAVAAECSRSPLPSPRRPMSQQSSATTTNSRTINSSSFYSPQFQDRGDLYPSRRHSYQKLPMTTQAYNRNNSTSNSRGYHQHYHPMTLTPRSAQHETYSTTASATITTPHGRILRSFRPYTRPPLQQQTSIQPSDMLGQRMSLDQHPGNTDSYFVNGSRDYYTTAPAGMTNEQYENRGYLYDQQYQNQNPFEEYAYHHY
jgi:hypothetical protein